MVVADLSFQVSDALLNQSFLWLLGETLSCDYPCVFIYHFTVRIYPTSIHGGLSGILILNLWVVINLGTISYHVDWYFYVPRLAEIKKMYTRIISNIQ